MRKDLPTVKPMMSSSTVACSSLIREAERNRAEFFRFNKTYEKAFIPHVDTFLQQYLMKINAYTVLVKRPKGMKTLGRHWRRWEDVKILWHVDTLLDNDGKISSYITAVAK
jgi:hypothetical protein